ncbi:MAG: radical SAM protein [Hungatella sp.]|nr:radical SAM protein [Hungatella sp.]
MKWKNRGEEFLKLKDNILKKRVYIYGAGDYGKKLFERMRIVRDQIVFIDGNKKKQKEGYCNRAVIPPERLSFELIENAILVVAASENNTAIIIKKLLLMGLEENRDFFRYRTFIDVFLPIYLYYSVNKVYFQDITILVTERCSLRCKKCAPMYPYLKNPRHRTLEQVKADLDQLFTHVDYVWDLIFTGGEPFIHPQFYDIIKYTINNYMEKFGHIQIISNGTVVPKTEILEIMAGRRKDLYVSVSNYMPFLKSGCLKRKFSECIRSFNEYKVSYELNGSENWVDFGFADNIKTSKKIEDKQYLSRFFDDCNSSCRAFYKGHFIYCVPAFYSDIAINDKEEMDYDNDNFYFPEGSAELLEWSLGFNNKGYLDMCKLCNGYITINSNFIKPAEQLV